MRGRSGSTDRARIAKVGAALPDTPMPAITAGWLPPFRSTSTTLPASSKELHDRFGAESRTTSARRVNQTIPNVAPASSAVTTARPNVDQAVTSRTVVGSNDLPPSVLR